MVRGNILFYSRSVEQMVKECKCGERLKANKILWIPPNPKKKYLRGEGKSNYG